MSEPGSDRSSWKNDHKSIVFLIFLVIAVGIGKLAMFSMIQKTAPARIFLPDSDSYDNTARAILQTGRFAISPAKLDIPQVERTPGYPFFIASIYFFFGEKSYAPLIISQILMSLGTISVTYFMAKMLWGHRMAMAAASFQALDFSSLVSSQQLLTETLFTFILSLALMTGIWVLKDRQHPSRGVFLHGLLLSLATLIRPVAYYAFFPVMIMFILIWKSHGRWRWPKVMRMLTIISVPWLILVGGWQLRNYLVTGNADFTSKQWEHLLFHFGAHIIAQRDGITFEEARYQRLGYGNYAKLHPETAGWSPSQLGQQWKREGLNLIRQEPWLFLKVWLLRGVLTMLLDPGEYAFRTYIGEETGPGKDFLELSWQPFVRKWVLAKPGFLVLYGLIESYLVLLYTSIAFSGWQAIRILKRSSLAGKEGWGEWQVHVFIWGLLVYFIIASAGINSRFRIPIMPFFSLYAGYGMSQMITRRIRNLEPEIRNTFE